MVKIISHGRPRCLRTATAESGFSVVELLAVMMVLLVMLAISIPYLYSYRKLYRSEDQALKVMDLMKEGSQLALNRRRTTRLEIDLTDNAVLLIDENGVAPDTLIKSIPLDPVNEVRIDFVPDGVDRPNPPDYEVAIFATDTLGHLRDGENVSGHEVWAARFRSDGSVVNAGDTPISATLYSWPPKSAAEPTVPRALEEVRAITMFGGSGSVRYWKHNGTSFVPY